MAVNFPADSSRCWPPEKLDNDIASSLVRQWYKNIPELTIQAKLRSPTLKYDLGHPDTGSRNETMIKWPTRNGKCHLVLCFWKINQSIDKNKQKKKAKYETISKISDGNQSYRHKKISQRVNSPLIIPSLLSDHSLNYFRWSNLNLLSDHSLNSTDHSLTFKKPECYSISNLDHT